MKFHLYTTTKSSPSSWQQTLSAPKMVLHTPSQSMPPVKGNHYSGLHHHDTQHLFPGKSMTAHGQRAPSCSCCSLGSKSTGAGQAFKHLLTEYQTEQGWKPEGLGFLPSCHVGVPTLPVLLFSSIKIWFRFYLSQEALPAARVTAAFTLHMQLCGLRQT